MDDKSIGLIPNDLHPRCKTGDIILHSEEHVVARRRYRRVGGSCGGDTVLVDVGNGHHPNCKCQLPLPLRERVRGPGGTRQAQLKAPFRRWHRYRHYECRPVCYLEANSQKCTRMYIISKPASNIDTRCLLQSKLKGIPQG